MNGAAGNNALRWSSEVLQEALPALPILVPVSGGEPYVLALNSGSSSLKFGLYGVTAEGFHALD